MIPRWIPQTVVDPLLYDKYPHVRRQLEEQEELRYVCSEWERPVEIWVNRRWLWLAQIEYWYARRAWWLYRLASRVGFLALEEGGYYRDGRWTWRFWKQHWERGYRLGLVLGRGQGHQATYRNGWRNGRRNGFELGSRFENRRVRYALRKWREEARSEVARML